MPFMIIVMLGLFPLTLFSSILVMMLVVVPYAGLQMWLGSLASHELLDMLFLLLLFMGIVLWLQSGQLLMLLKLYRESTRDMLTGLINRRVLIKFLGDEVDQNRDTGRRFSVLMLDLDRFKYINDDYGHMTGDVVLKATARLLENEMRLSDIVARFGGEEFVAVLPGLASDAAVAVAERICKACTGIQVLAADGREVTFTCSIGVTEYIGGEAIETTLRRADDALYDAKEQGRNRVICNPV
jgi:diguanylate cyclase (GGDEF)-like protein